MDFMKFLEDTCRAQAEQFKAEKRAGKELIETLSGERKLSRQRDNDQEKTI